MKVHLFIAAIIIITTACKAPLVPDNTIVIEGNVKGVPNGKLYLAEAHRWNVPLDSTTCVDGHFIFRLKTDSTFYPYMASINYEDSKSPVGKSFFFFRNYMLGADSMKYSGNGFYLEKGNTYIEGDNTVKPLLRVFAGRETDMLYRHQMADFGWPSTNDSAKRGKQLTHFQYEIKQYPYSYFLLSGIDNAKEQYTKAELRQLLSLFNDDVQQSVAGKAISHYLEISHETGEAYPNLLLANVSNEKELMLDAKAPINMLVFWASWCGPCRKEIPALKDIYKTYQSKGVRLVNISIDEQEEKWRTALAEEKMDWPQYLVARKEIEEVMQQFNFTSIPLVILVDGNGGEIARFSGYSIDGKTEYITAIEKTLKIKTSQKPK